MPVAIKSCTCNHEFQDARYGKGMRVFNYQPGKGKVRCSVCGTVKLPEFVGAKAKAEDKGKKKK